MEQKFKEKSKMNELLLMFNQKTISINNVIISLPARKKKFFNMILFRLLSFDALVLFLIEPFCKIIYSEIIICFLQNIIINQKIKKLMKSIIQMDSSSNSLGLMPFKNKKISSKPEPPKDLLLLLPEPQQKQTELKILSVVNMSVYNLKNTYKDKRKIKDAVTVKRMKLLCKQNVELKKIPVLMNVVKRSSLNYSGSTDYSRKKNEKCQGQIFSKLVFNPLDGIAGNRTFSSPISPNNFNTRKGLKLERIEKQNQICGTIFETKPIVTNTKCDDLINTKLKYYLSFVKQGRKLYNLPEELNKQPKKRALKVKIRKGNNSQLIKWLFKKRWWWTIQDEKDEKQKNKPNFIWSQLKEKTYFEGVPQSEQNQNQISLDHYCHNHFPHNEYLGNKKALFYNMRRYYTSKKMEVFDHLPLTFHVISTEDEAWNQFTRKYEQFKQKGHNNIWILKPGENSNRGRGITVHQSYEEIKSIVGSGQTFVDTHDSKTKNRTYIIQSYIDKPFLYNKRKFDIRCYMLLVNINKIVKGYWYTQGYIRTSSFEFQLNDFNTFVHLTNDAIQNNSQSYGKFEEGNKLSYAQFQKYLDSKHSGCGFDLEKQIIPQMKQIATDSIKAAIHFVKGQSDRPVFEVFGLDFMIDKNFKPWLIEINTNPCIETSCMVLQKIIPRMLDDSLKLSLDILFPPPQNWPASRKHCLPSSQNKFELVYQSQKDEQIDIKTVKFPSLGVITQDGEFYEEKQNDFN